MFTMIDNTQKLTELYHDERFSTIAEQTKSSGYTTSHNPAMSEDDFIYCIQRICNHFDHIIDYLAFGYDRNTPLKTMLERVSTYTSIAPQSRHLIRHDANTIEIYKQTYLTQADFHEICAALHADMPSLYIRTLSSEYGLNMSASQRYAAKRNSPITAAKDAITKSLLNAVTGLSVKPPIFVPSPN